MRRLQQRMTWASSWFPSCSVTPDIIMFSPHNWKPAHALYPLDNTSPPGSAKQWQTLYSNTLTSGQPLSSSRRYHLQLEDTRSLLTWNVGREGKACSMCDLQQETHWDWIDLDDMNNLADTKGGNINAHIYSNLSSAGAWMLCLSHVEKQQMPWINPEMFPHLRMIHIQMDDNDSQINLWQEPLLVVVLWEAGNFFFPSWPLARQRLVSQLIPW